LWKNEKCQDPSGGIFLTHTVQLVDTMIGVLSDGVVLNPRQYRLVGCEQSLRNVVAQRQKPNPPPPPIRRSSSIRG